MSKNKLYKLKEKFQELSKMDYDLAMKIAPEELQIHRNTFRRDLEGIADETIPHIRILKYAKLLDCDTKDLEAIDREEIKVRSIKQIPHATIPDKFYLNK
jgi:hypothetical protein